MARPPKRWTLALGSAGARVVARERTLGGSVWLYTYDRRLGGSRKKSLGFPVRDADGALLDAALERAKKEADALVAADPGLARAENKGLKRILASREKSSGLRFTS